MCFIVLVPLFVFLGSFWGILGAQGSFGDMVALWSPSTMPVDKSGASDLLARSMWPRHAPSTVPVDENTRA